MSCEERGRTLIQNLSNKIRIKLMKAAANTNPDHLYRETGRVAFFQAQSDNGAPTIAGTEACKVVSRDLMASLMKEERQVCRLKTNKGRDKLERNKTYFICESPNAGSKSNLLYSLASH